MPTDVHSAPPAALALGPWCWPPSTSGRRDALIQRHGPVPEMALGRAPAITVRGTTVSLWALVSEPVRAALPTATLGPEARQSWQAASLALPRSLPVLWRDVRDLSREPPQAVRLCSHLAAPGVQAREPLVDGRSFGLSFLLVLASRVLGLPLPPDVIASVAVDELGRASRVEDLALKLEGVNRLAPTIARVLVAADQHDEAVRCAGRLDVVSVRTASQALDLVFGAALGARLADAGTDDGRRRELVEAFFRLALVGRGATVDWSPVERGATAALRDWPVDAVDRYRLRFAAAVAARHERNAGDVPLPDAAWLAAQPMPLRLAVLTHLVQQAADAGVPSWRETEALATAYLPSLLSEAFVPQLKLAGAVGRLWAVTGRAREALDLQRRVAQAFLAAFEDLHASYQLSEWLRLAAGLGDAGAFRDAEDVVDHLETTGGMSAAGAPYLALSHARGCVQLGRVDAGTAETLDRLAVDLRVPAHVRWSACRWAVRAWRQAGQGSRAEARLAEMMAAAGSVAHARRYLALVDLDTAIDEGRGDVEAGLARLRALDPGPVGHLLEAHASAADVVRFYPY